MNDKRPNDTLSDPGEAPISDTLDGAGGQRYRMSPRGWIGVVFAAMVLVILALTFGGGNGSAQTFIPSDTTDVVP